MIGIRRGRKFVSEIPIRVVSLEDTDISSIRRGRAADYESVMIDTDIGSGRWSTGLVGQLTAVDLVDECIVSS